MPYHHRQVGYFTIFALIVTSAVILPLLATAGRILLVPIICVAFLIVGVLFSTLTIDVGNGVLKFWFGIGVIRKQISLSDIASCTSTTTTILSGWGIHLTLRGWLCNVSGFNAVEIILKNGKRFLLGSDEPNELCAAILRELGASVAGKELH